MKYSLTALAFALVLNTSAQQETQNSFYMFNASLLNPAYAGSRDALSVVADARLQWVNWDGAPRTNCFTLHTPLVIESVGLGLNVLNDVVGASTRNSIFSDFSYRIRLNKNNDRLAFGLRAGVDLITNNFGKLAVNDNTDPIIAQNSFNKTLFNTGAGIYLYGKRYFVGVTAPKFIPNKTSDLSSFASKEALHVYFIAGYVFKLNSMWDLKPGVCARYTANAPLSIDANLSVLFNKKIWFGVMYRYGAAAGANIMYQFTNSIRFGYAYDYSMTNMSKYTSGTHEILLGFDFFKKSEPVRSPRYF
ncbi:MAG: type IX secretion system membrane protein PorP/SprF [Bacteroidota bacterium]|nr:type IX secretion system membrane protein PorP/SprF [Bacteroidota bacterium]